MNTNFESVISVLHILIGAPVCAYALFYDYLCIAVLGMGMAVTGVAFLYTQAVNKDTLNTIEKLILHERERKVEP